MRLALNATAVFLLLGCAALAQYPTEGLIVHYPLREHAEDVSGNNHHLINKQVTFPKGGVKDTSETFAYFNGQASLHYNKSGHNNAFNLQTYSISLWARVDGMPNLYGNLFEFGETQFLRFFRPNDGGPWRLQGGYRYGLGLEWITHDLAYNLSGFFLNWHHYVLTSSFENNQNIMRLYVDGDLVNTEIEFMHPFILYTFADSLLHIGGRPNTQFLNLRGGIQDVFYYNRVLTGEEILQLNHYTLEGPTSLDDLAVQPAGGKLFPNPVRDQLFLDLEDPAAFQIFDIRGQLRLSGMFRPGTGISVQDLTPGVYILRTEGHSFRFVRE